MRNFSDDRKDESSRNDIAVAVRVVRVVKAVRAIRAVKAKKKSH